MRTQQLIAYVFVSWLVSLLGGSAMAKPAVGDFNKQLTGPYRVSVILTCAAVDGTLGFIDNSPSFLANGIGNPHHVSVTGVTTYDGADSVTITDRGVAIFSGPYVQFSPAASTFVGETCAGTYTVNSDGSFSVVLSCTELDGNTLTNINYVGQIGANGDVVSTTRVGSGVETMKDAAGTTLFQRICAGTGTELRIDKK